MGQLCSSSTAVATTTATPTTTSNSRHMTTLDNGTGYNGSHRSDRKRLLEGRREAVTQAQQHDLETTRYLGGVASRLESSSLFASPLSDEELKTLCHTLRETLRNIPSDWAERLSLYEAALNCCRVMASISSTNVSLYRKWLLRTSEEEDHDDNTAPSESLLECLDEVSQHAAHMVKYQHKHGGVIREHDLRLASQVMEVKTLVEQAAAAISGNENAIFPMAQSNKSSEEINKDTVATIGTASTTASSDDSDGNPETPRAHVVRAVSIISYKKGSPQSTKKKDPSDNYREVLGPLRFDLVEGPLVHYAFAGSKLIEQKLGTPLDATRRLFKELATFRTALPVEYGSSIFVRAVEDRLDQLRVLITGPEGTPYANGCFFFDVFLPPSYPAQPPVVQFLTTGGGVVRFNPNLYKCGKVCLSLLGTWWFGPGWVPGESTLLQVLVSIQSLILVQDPYFNEPAFQRTKGTSRGDKQSESYNRGVEHCTLQYATQHYLEQIVRSRHEDDDGYDDDNDDSTKSTTHRSTTPDTSGAACCDYPEFAPILRHHFTIKRQAILKQAHAWMARSYLVSDQRKRLLDDLTDLFDQLQQRRPQDPPPTKRSHSLPIESSCPILLEQKW